MKRRLVFVLLFLLIGVSFVSAVEPMILRTIKEIKSVNPESVANLGFGVYQISAQYNLGSYHEGDWMGEENKNRENLVIGAFWVEFSWDRPETDVVLIDGAGVERKIYLPASTLKGNSSYGEYYWISEDGSSYYANTNHGYGWPDLTYEQALVSEHLARETLSQDQKNPEEEEPPVLGIEESGGGIKLKGRLINQVSNEPISDAKLNSAYEFFPAEVITDSNGNFEFVVSTDLGGAWDFYSDCYGWANNIGLQKDYEFWKDGELKAKYDLALRKTRFDAEEEVTDVSGQTEIDVGIIYAWPSADISIISDIKASFNVQYKYKNSYGYNGPGQGGYREDHYLSTALPVDYDVFIQFEDEQGNEYKSTTYRVPLESKCGVITLKYFNEESEWLFLSEIQPDEETGPIELPEEVEDISEEIISSLCNGCLKDSKCYPFGYRKDGKYCTDFNNFVDYKEAKEFCDNNFECNSNICVDSECISSGFLKRVMNWFRRLFGGD